MELALDNEDLLTAILLRLPAKSLTRFKCVCKKWWTLISSDYFCHHHTLRRPKLQPSLILQVHDWYDFPRHYFYFNGAQVLIPYSLGVPDHQILQACNGLLLLELKQQDYPEQFAKPTRYDRLRRWYVVYNPTTRQSRTIHTTTYGHPSVEGVSLAFDPSKSPYYKIVCIRSTAESNSRPIYFTYEIEVYESETHSWRPVRLEAAFSYPGIEYAVYWNNTMYWANMFVDGLCYFNIATNEVKTLSFPETPEPSRAYDCHLQESDDHLYLFQFIFESDHHNSVAVWELGINAHDHNHTEWLLKHHHVINVDRAVGAQPSMMRLSHRDRDGDGGATCSLITCRYRNPISANGMRAYNFVDKTSEVLVDFSTQPSFPEEWSFIRAFQFGETLALV